MIKLKTLDSPRDLVHSEDSLPPGAKTRPFTTLLARMMKYDTQMVARRTLFIEEPSWLFLFLPRHQHAKSQRFLNDCYRLLSLAQRHPGISPVDFHSETGKICKALTSYLKEVKDQNKATSFVRQFRDYMVGKRKRFPTNVSRKKEVYSLLKSLSKEPYATRLTGSGAEPPTQDVAILYKAPLYELVEQVLTSMNNEEVVRYLDKVRLR